MKKTAIYLALITALGLTACSSTKVADVGSGAPVPAGTQQAISEQRLSNTFKRDGIRVIYTLRGDLEAMEATVYAPIWGNSQNSEDEAYRLAEVLAKDAIKKFIYNETIENRTSVMMFSRNLEKARDNKTNNFATNRARNNEIDTDDEEAENKTNANADINRQENTAIRNDALTLARSVRTNITVRSAGIVGGIYLKEAEVVKGGKFVQATYRWDTKHQAARVTIRNSMAQ